MPYSPPTMTTFNKAQEIIAAHAKSFGTERVNLEAALGRVLAEPVLADRDYPPFNRATMDGYAFKLADIQKGLREFSVIETIFAGQLSATRLSVGQCFKIMTGAPVPIDADLIIRREDINEGGQTINILQEQYKAYQNIARQGEDIRSGQLIINPPVICTPAVISALAAVGKTSVLLEKLPELALFTTGDELVSPESAVAPQQIRNSNQYLLKALLQKWGITPVLCEHIKDEKTALYEMLKKGSAADIIIISGGVSAGDADYVPEILESLQVRKLFHKLSIKPGKPIWCGYIPGGAMVFALPGNPFSSLITFTLFVENYLSRSLQQGDPVWVSLPLIGQRSKMSSLDEFFPVSIQQSPLGAIQCSFHGSGDILAAIRADGIAQHPAALNKLDNGQLVNVRIFKS